MGTDNATSTASAEGEGTESPDLSSHAGDVARARDAEFWFEDGTIVLVARHVEFRVYKSILADHSPVFSDMFLALPIAVCAAASAVNGRLHGEPVW